MGEATRYGSTWKWTVCVLLLFATMLNYMDRLTLNQQAAEIMAAFAIEKPEYGYIESAFAIAFATGALLGGWMVDRWNVWWVYPLAVTAWSAAGVATAFAGDYHTLVACRFCLGLAEAIHWPCALRTTQRILSKDERTLGNSILQSGAALGAVLAPLVILGLLEFYDDWRPSFVAVGGMGILWVIAWLLIVRRQDLALPLSEPASGSTRSGESLLHVLADRRFWVLGLVVLCINSTWHYFRAWMPLFLREAHEYSAQTVQLFSSAYYLSTDIGSLTAGFVTLFLIRQGLQVHSSRLLVFGTCAVLTSLSLLVNQLEAGPLLLGVLLLIGFAALGLFPNYYSFSQELTVKHQGKITGMLGCINWIGMAVLHGWVGENVQATKSYATGLTLAGLMPCVALASLLLFWREKDGESPPPPRVR